MTARRLPLLCVVLLGCTKAPPAAPTGPTYAEALGIYNQEMELLERLKKSASEAETAHEQKLLTIRAADLLGNSAKGIEGLADLANLDLTSDDGAAKAKELSDKSKSQLTELGAKASPEMEAAIKEHKAHMEKLNQAVREQEEKVAKAKQVKDEAESRR